MDDDGGNSGFSFCGVFILSDRKYNVTAKAITNNIPATTSRHSLFLKIKTNKFNDKQANQK